MSTPSGQDQMTTQQVPGPGNAPGQQPNAGPAPAAQDHLATQQVPAPGYAAGQQPNAGPASAAQDHFATQQVPAPGYAAGQQPNAAAGYGPPPQQGGFAGQPGIPAQQGQPGPGQYGQPGFAPNQHQNQYQQPAFAGPDPFPQAKASFGAALQSEWTKIRSVRSTFWTLLITMVITIGLGSLIALGSSSHPSPDDDFTANSMSGLFFGQLVIVVFGAMAITAEYSTGMIRTSLTSQPRRGTLFWAKAAIVAAVALVVGLVCSFVSFFIATAIYSGHGITVSLSDPGVLRAVIGGGLYMTGTALLAFGLGAILRHTAGAITTAVGLLFVLFILVQFLPGTWRTDISKWIPFNAGLQIITTRPQDDMLSPWAGFAVFAAYAAAAVIGGAIVMRKKDA
ncbi:ABC-type transport system involved in multi-copper enzyme maturation permease subunit [Catenulispora sp. MAP12-49]|uniref:ABC transporter permease subunit n=1 Tax=Catenulispora sp. MAP12-49 TaxID=3156302 RepID=UPI0035196CE0